MKKIVWIGIAILSICFVCAGCFSVQNMNQLASKMDQLANRMDEITESISEESPADSEEEGIVYADPNLNMVLSIFTPGIRYEKNDELGQVYFYFPEDSSNQNIISISMQPAQEDTNAQIGMLWEAVKENLDTLDVRYGVEKEISVGKDHEGKTFDFVAGEGESVIKGQYVFWEADGNIYICSVTADEDHTEVIYGSVEDILESFLTYEEIEAQQ